MYAIILCLFFTLQKMQIYSNLSILQEIGYHEDLPV